VTPPSLPRENHLARQRVKECYLWVNGLRPFVMTIIVIDVWWVTKREVPIPNSTAGKNKARRGPAWATQRVEMRAITPE
jgi:hypothetical protein